MSNMNLLVDLKGYTGTNANTCRPSFSKNAQIIGLDVSEEIIQEVTIGTSSTVALFDVTGNPKKLIYLEADKECDIILNGVTESTLKPLVLGSSTVNGMYLKTCDINTVSVTNNSVTDTVKVYFITVK